MGRIWRLLPLPILPPFWMSSPFSASLPRARLRSACHHHARHRNLLARRGDCRLRSCSCCVHLVLRACCAQGSTCPSFIWTCPTLNSASARLLQLLPIIGNHNVTSLDLARAQPSGWAVPKQGPKIIFIACVIWRRRSTYMVGLPNISAEVDPNLHPSRGRWPRLRPAFHSPLLFSVHTARRHDVAAIFDEPHTMRGRPLTFASI
jgi:hypothetical protein